LDQVADAVGVIGLACQHIDDDVDLGRQPAV
jgi:hypothetical protein